MKLKKKLKLKKKKFKIQIIRETFSNELPPQEGHLGGSPLLPLPRVFDLVCFNSKFRGLGGSLSFPLSFLNSTLV